MQLINPNYPWKNEVKQKKATQKKKKKLLQRCIFYPMAKDPDPNDGVKCIKKIFLNLTTTCHIPELIWFVQYFLLFLLNPFGGQFGYFVLRTFLSSKIWDNVIKNGAS